MNTLLEFLRTINRVPFPISRPNHVALASKMGDAVLPEEKMLKEGWDALRSSHPKYSFSENRDVWLKEIYEKRDGQDKETDQRAKDIVALCRKYGHRSIFSVGAGAASLEYRIAKIAPDINVTISDYPPDTIRKLKKVFLEGKVQQFDALRGGDWQGVDPTALVLIYRMDREFTPSEWIQIFGHMNKVGIAHSLFILQYTFTLLWFVQERIRTFRNVLKGFRISMAGYIHNVPSLRRLWSKFYSDVPVQIGSWQGFYLSNIK